MGDHGIHGGDRRSPVIGEACASLDVANDLVTTPDEYCDIAEDGNER